MSTTLNILQHLFGYFVDIGHYVSNAWIRNETLLSTRSINITKNRNIIYDGYNKNNENHKPCGKSLSTLIILLGTLFLDIYLQKLVISFHDKIIRSSRWQMFFKIGVLKNFAIFTEKHLCWSLFLIMLQTIWPVTFYKRDSNRCIFL